MTVPARAEGVLMILSQEDTSYVNRLTGPLSSCRVMVYDRPVPTLVELASKAKSKGLDKIITTRQDVLVRLLPEELRKTAKISNYAGSILKLWLKEDDYVEVLILHPLKQLVTVPYMEFLAGRYISKFTKPAKWFEPYTFVWEVADDPFKYDDAERYLEDCDLIAVDIETANLPAKHITMIGYTGVRIGKKETKTFVIPIDSMEAVYAMRRINTIHVPKLFQNGKYDCAWLAAYSAPCWGYFYDTVNAFHAWYCEMPKDLAMITGFFIRDSCYWKDLAKVGNKQDQFRYNALDTYSTAMAWLAWVEQAPDWAKKNYVMEFSVVPGAHLCEMTGLKRNMETLYRIAGEQEAIMDKHLAAIRTMVGEDNFNPSSPPQVLKLLHILGMRQLDSSDEKSLVKAAYAHPLNERIIHSILDFRKARKLISTYLTTGAKAKEFKDRLLYSLNPHGTETGRLASKEHHFWCGLQVQNAPKGPFKKTVDADPDFVLWEADFSQAEDRGVAYCSGDENLLEIFFSGIDSHKYKASMFFGVPIEEITKAMRQLGKRINHGSNYNMGPTVLVETMGPKAVREAQRLLGLPKNWDLKAVATHLLNIYAKAFPTVKTDYYDSIVKEVITTQKMVGPTGWTRYCFGNPKKNKMDLNAYVAHKTQSLNAMCLNRAFIAVFNELGMNPHFKMHAQIHDSLLFQTHKDHEHLAERVKELMTFPVPITDCKGTTRELVVPVDLTRLGSTWAGD